MRSVADLTKISTVSEGSLIQRALTAFGFYNSDISQSQAGYSLIGYWKFDEGTGTTLVDSSGNGHHGTITDPIWSNGKVGGCLYFDGLGSSVVTVPDHSDLDLTGPFTITAWVNPSALFTDLRAVICKNYVYYLYSSSGGFCGDGGILGGFFSNSTAHEFCYSTPLAATTWTHLAITYDGSSQLKFYLNGVYLQGTGTGGVIDTSDGVMQIGATQYGEYFSGSIDEVRLYNGALSEAAVYSIYAENGVPSVTIDKSIYAPGEQITAIVSGGYYGLEEWVSPYTSTDPDTSYQNDWQYINGTQVKLTEPPTYPITLIFYAPVTAGTYNLRYFLDADNYIRIAISGDFTVSSPFTPDYYASPTGAGTHDGLTSGNAMQISEFWDVAAPGLSLGLLDGTYTGDNSMIEPTVGLSGSAGFPILIQAINDGAVVIDGEGAREPLRLKGNNYITFNGFDVCNSSVDAVVIGGSSTNACSHITCQRIVAYDAALVNQAHIWNIWNSSDVLIEDCAGFGIGRYVLNCFSAVDPKTTTIRRFWGRWMRQTDTPSSGGPKGINLCYDADNILAENVFATWDETENSGAPTDGYGPLWAAGNNPPILNIRLFGCMSYVRTVDAMAEGTFVGMINVFGTVLGSTVEHCVAYVEPAGHTFAKGFLLDDYTGGGDSNRFVNRCTSINNTANTITGQWTQSGNLFNQSSVPTGIDNIWNGASSNGARIYYRYVDGVLTATPLWPWPMDARIAAAVTASGRSVTTFFGAGNSGLTDLMEDIFGAIP